MFSLPAQLFCSNNQTRHHGAPRRTRRGSAPVIGTRLALEQLEDKRMLAADPFMLGGEFQVNTFADGHQTNPDIAMDAAGNYVVAWQSFDGTTSGIYAQRYSGDGSPLGGEIVVDELELAVYNEGVRQFPAVAMNDQGSFVVAWQIQNGMGSYDLFAQPYAADGTPLGSDFQVNATTDRSYMYPDVALDDDGDFMVTWNQVNAAGNARHILGRRYDSDGTPEGSEFQINTTGTNSIAPSVARTDDGETIVTWGSFGADGSSGGIVGQRYASDGTPLGGEFLINTYTANNQTRPSVAVDDTGNFVVAWESMNQDGSGHGVFGQRFAANGAALGSEFQVNTFTNGTQYEAAVAMADSGEFVVTWASFAQDGEYYGVFGQRYNADGTPRADEFQINTTTANQQDTPAVAMNDAGNLVVVWQSWNSLTLTESDIFGQRFDFYGEAPSEVVVFEDSFEVSEWNGLWVEDGQNDWFRSTQRATDGNRSAEVDGNANNATLTLSSPIDLSGYASAELTFDWLIESGFDSGEYVALDVYDGTSWDNDVLRLNGNSDSENMWHAETVDLTPYMSTGTLIRFRAKVSSSTEDANVDNVRIVAMGTAAPNELPTADAGGPYATSEGSSVTLDASGSFDTDGSITSYEWDLDNDGQYDDATGSTANFGTTVDGVHTVGLRVTDDRGDSNTDSTVVMVSNAAPNADAGGPYDGFVGQGIVLNAAGSTDPGNDIVIYEWDLDGDGEFDDATGSSAVYTSATAGNALVSVRVTDDDGAASTDSATVEVSDVPSEVTVFVDSFENGQWNGQWVENSQNDWFTSTQRETDGNYSAEVDGSANNATLTLSSPIDLSGYASAELTFDWLIESSFDKREYLALDVFNGSNWINGVLSLDGNSDAENVWHSEALDLTPFMSADTLIRFRAKVSDSSEDANVDNVKIVAVGTGGSGMTLASFAPAATTTGLARAGQADPRIAQLTAFMQSGKAHRDLLAVRAVQREAAAGGFAMESGDGGTSVATDRDATAMDFEHLLDEAFATLG